MQWRSRYTAVALFGVIAWTVLVALPGAWWTPDKYSAWATGLSTIAVVLALVLAVITLRTDVKGRQVDRTLSLHAEFTSGENLSKILRFFERARLVRGAGSADDPLFVELIGRHVCWWNCALIRDSSRGTRRALMQLGLWCDAFAGKHKRRYSYLANWGEARTRDFGSTTPWQNDPP